MEGIRQDGRAGRERDASMKRRRYNSFPSAQAWLEHYAVPVPESGCWIFEGFIHKLGYGQMMMAGKTIKAHRASWVMFNGPIPPRMFVCHTCDTPSCINPKHLFLGTCADNVHDMMRKGRAKIIRKSHCIKGHPLQRTSWDAHGKCRICLRAANERVRVRKWAAYMLECR